MYRGISAVLGDGARGLRALIALSLGLRLLSAPRVAGAQTGTADSAAAAPPAVTPPAPAVAPPAISVPSRDAAQQAISGTAPAAAEADTVPDADGGWPRLILAPSGATIILYQPQVLSWKDQRHMVAMCAVSYTPKGAPKADLGTVQLESKTSTSIEERMVNFIKVDITGMSFQSLQKTETQEVLNEIRKSLPKDSVLISHDRILAAVDKSTISAQNVKINTDPPPIFYSKKPAILVQFDGEPILVHIDGTSLKYVVNTNWDVFTHETTTPTGSRPPTSRSGSRCRSCPRISRSWPTTTTGKRSRPTSRARRSASRRCRSCT